MSDELLLYAFELHKRNKFFEASEIYKQILSSNPNDHNAMHYLGLIYLQNGFVKEGEFLINKAINIAGDYPEALHNLEVFRESEKFKVIQEIESIVQHKDFPKYEEELISGWRMRRMMDFMDTFSRHDVNSNWLTIGDAYGHDAIILKKTGLKNVTASNLDASLLRLGNQLGYVEEFLEINAEKIELQKTTYDYIVCKEALHHMPRPYMAIYEMLRVARNALFMIEPLDTMIDYQRPKNSVVERELQSNNERSNYIKDSVRYCWPSENDGESNTYEVFTDWYEDGAFNYVYTLSVREIRKICYGLGLPGFAYKTFNDIYDSELDKLECNEKNLELIINQINLQDIFCNASGKPPSYISTILFKKIPEPNILAELTTIGYTFCSTPTIFMPFKFMNLNKESRT
jgi:ubiquinone/menaquinone biosynthesis C-methylase UbiE